MERAIGSHAVRRTGHSLMYRLWRGLDAWRRAAFIRRGNRNLLEMSDRDLRDIGVSRDEIRFRLRRPKDRHV